LEDNIKMELRVIGWGDMDWIDVAEDRDQWRALEKSSIVWTTVAFQEGLSSL
jgi:hypothetical protein